MWESKSKYDLIIEVWEKLDCESVGRAEIEAIETVIYEIFGGHPQDTPMRLARILADEGAELRHSEIMELDVERRSSKKDLPLISRPLDFSDTDSALRSINELETLRRQFVSKGNSEGIRDLRAKAITARDGLRAISVNPNKSLASKKAAAEFAEWMAIWIESPEIFETWIKARGPESRKSQAVNND